MLEITRTDKDDNYTTVLIRNLTYLSCSVLVTRYNGNVVIQSRNGTYLTADEARVFAELLTEAARIATELEAEAATMGTPE